MAYIMSNSWADELDHLLSVAGFGPEQEALAAQAHDQWHRVKDSESRPGTDLWDWQLTQRILTSVQRRAARGPSQKTLALGNALPKVLRARLGFQEAACAIAVVLARAAYPQRHVKMTVAALAQASGMARRSVQRALRYLEAAELVMTAPHKIRKDFNEPNLYCLAEEFEEWFRRPTSGSARQGGDSKDARLTEINNQTDTSYNERVGYAPDREQRRVLPEVNGGLTASIGVGRMLPSLESGDLADEDHTVLPVNDAPADWESLANRAVAVLDPDANDGNPWLALDRLRRERLKGLQQQFWERAASKHAHRALLAVAEVLLRPAGYFTTGPLAYLAGILRRVVGKCAPERSVARLLAERSGQAYPEGEIALPLGVKPVETIAPPEDPVRRRVFETVGAATYRSWFEKADICAEPSGTIIRLSSAWQTKWVQENYGFILSRMNIMVSAFG